MAARSNMPVMRDARPRSRSNRKLIFLLILFFITILLLLFFHSSFSRITSIEISGNVYVTKEQILEASGIELEDHFFAATAERIRQRVMEIDIVKEAAVTKHFPGQVMIEVIEYPEVAYQITPDGEQEALLANGSALPIKDSKVIIDKPILSGWEDEEMKRRLTNVLANIPANLLADISEIKPSPSDAYEDKIVMYTRSYFQIVTSIEKLPDKIQYYRFLIEEQLARDVQGGVITMLEADVFRPYPAESGTEAEISDDSEEAEEEQ